VSRFTALNAMDRKPATSLLFLNIVGIFTYRIHKIYVCVAPFNLPAII
jgi:hypothetical protein